MGLASSSNQTTYAIYVVCSFTLKEKMMKLAKVVCKGLRPDQTTALKCTLLYWEYIDGVGDEK